MARKPYVFIVSGPSGSGKSSVVEHVLRVTPRTTFSVSWTTRAPRPGEQSGRDYYFVDDHAFQEMIDRDEFLEHAEVVGNFYGTPRSHLDTAEREGNDLVLDIDVLGAKKVKAKLPDAVATFLVPPSRTELEERLRGRGQDSPEIIQRRLERARLEIESYDSYDYVVVNRDLAETCLLVEAIVKTERGDLDSDAEKMAREDLKVKVAAARREATADQVSAILSTFDRDESQDRRSKRE